MKTSEFYGTLIKLAGHVILEIIFKAVPGKAIYSENKS